MNFTQNYLLPFSILIFCFYLINFSPDHIYRASENSPPDKEIKSLFVKMVPIEADTFIMGRVSPVDLKITSVDTTLFSPGVPQRAMVGSFYISATEVTNADWKAFYRDKVTELGAAAAKARYFPDTSLWLKEFPYTYNAPMAKNYYAHPSYLDFPVVGISWEQANAFCIWKTDQLQALLKDKGIQSSATFRLPTEAEWECAASSQVDGFEQAERRVYPWPATSSILEVCCMTNIGQIHDANGVLLKSYAEDGCLYTCQVARYDPNYRGIYDLAGNVAEWTSDQGYAVCYDFENKTVKKLTSLGEVESEIERLRAKIEFKDPYERTFIDRLIHDKQVLQASDTRICKGGSWADGMIYAQTGSRRAVPKDQGSTKIGFRLVLSDADERLLKYFPKNGWKP